MSFQQKFCYAPQPMTERGRPTQMNADAKATKFLYTNGRTVIIRDLKNPELSDEYNGHNCIASVAKFSPSGYYIASGDVQGNVKIWDATQTEHILKTETKSITGKINDLAWDFESKRVIAVGDGKDKFGHAFLFDSASSCGESVSIKPSRPFKAVTGSDDFSINFYNGVPYKFDHSIKEHTRFVQCVRYSPQGDHFVSTSSDAKIILFDGKTGAKLHDLSADENTHKGTVFAAAWSPDSKEILTCSADMTAKIWDVAGQKVVNTVKFCDNTNANYHQVGALWAGSYLISLSLNGDLNYLDPRMNKPAKIVKGHQKGISSLAISNDTIFTGSSDGTIRHWTTATGNEEISGQGHNNRVISLGSSDDKIYSCGMDDSFRALSISTKQFEQQALPTSGLPKGMSVGKTCVAVATGDKVNIYGAKKNTFKFQGNATAVAISNDEKIVAVGDDTGVVHLHDIDTFAKISTLNANKGQITTINYSPQGDLVAVGDSKSNIMVYSIADYTVFKFNKVKIETWVFHTGRVTCFSWAPDGQHAVSGSLDTSIEIWSVKEPMKHISIKSAHQESVTGVGFLSPDKVVSVGADGFIKGFELKYF